jgi:6-phosphofructokinase 1
MAKRIGLLMGGGDAPGQNVCLKAIVYNAIDRGYNVVGIRKGWEGLMYYQPENTTTHADNVMILNKSRVRDIDRLGGAYLHSSRLHPGHVSPEQLPVFLQARKKGNEPVDITDHIKQVLSKLQLDALIVLGDRVMLEYAAQLGREGVPIIGIPKTVHNNVGGSDYCLGFSTALARGVHFVQEIRAMAGSREEIAVIEILGRSTGLTTLLVSLLASADRTLIPEVQFDPEKLAALLMEDKRANPTNYSILVMSEASTMEPDKAVKYVASTHVINEMAGERQIGARVTGAGAIVTEVMENITGQRCLFQPLSYLIRTGEPDGQDLLGAMNFATLATNLLAAGKTGRLIAYRQGENYVDVPLDVVTQPAPHINVTDHYDARLYTPKSSVLWAARV